MGYVTNGVHFPTWCATEWRHLYDKYFDPTFMSDQSNEKIWHAIYDVPDKEIWETRMALKKKLVKYIRDKFSTQWLRNQGDPAKVVSILERINPNALMIGFCRRFATYKSALICCSPTSTVSKRLSTTLSIQYCSSSRVRLILPTVPVRDSSRESSRLAVCRSSSVRLSSLRTTICVWPAASFRVLISG